MDYQELRSALLHKGQAQEDAGRDHSFFFIEVDGKLERATKMSHGARGQINDELLSKMARQMRLSVNELRQFVQCTVGRKEWVENWSTRPGLWNR